MNRVRSLYCKIRTEFFSSIYGPSAKCAGHDVGSSARAALGEYRPEVLTVRTERSEVFISRLKTLYKYKRTAIGRM